MTLLDILEHTPLLLIFLVTVIGLIVGSFLNVVIYRLPLMMQRQWRNECLQFLSQPADPAIQERFNLFLPLSRCPHCQTGIKPYQNIPVLSYLLLKGRCASCSVAISIRYPIIEALTGILSAMVALNLGFSAALPWALVLTWSLIALSFIDLDSQLLPDSITQPLLWLGLFLSVFTIFASPDSSIIGTISGYLSLWTVYQVFKLTTGKEGMGYGDFKLLALLGAWLGWQFLPLIILLSSCVGAVVGLAMIIFAKHDHQIPIPFGPYLAAAGWIALIWGGKLNALYLGFVGI